MALAEHLGLSSLTSDEWAGLAKEHGAPPNDSVALLKAAGAAGGRRQAGRCAACRLRRVTMIPRRPGAISTGAQERRSAANPHSAQFSQNGTSPAAGDKHAQLRCTALPV